MVETTLKFTVPPEEAGLRLDRFVASHSPQLSRTRIQELIEAGLVLLNGKPAKGSHKVHPQDVVDVIPAPRPALQAEAEYIPLDILYEDQDVIAINKPAGMMVHAGAGNLFRKAATSYGPALCIALTRKPRESCWSQKMTSPTPNSPRLFARGPFKKLTLLLFRAF